MAFNEPLLPRDFRIGRDTLVIEQSPFRTFRASSKSSFKTFSDPFDLAAYYAPELYDSISYPISALPIDFYHLAAGARQVVLLALINAQIPKTHQPPHITQLCEALAFIYKSLHLPDSTLFNRALSITNQDRMRAALLFIYAGAQVRKRLRNPPNTSVAPLYSFFKIYASDTHLHIRYQPDQTIRRIGTVRTKIEMEYYACAKGTRKERREWLILSCIKSYYSADQSILPSIPEDLFRKLKIHISQMVTATFNGTPLPELPILNFQQPENFSIIINPPKGYKAPRPWKHARLLKPDIIYTTEQLLALNIPKTAIPRAVKEGHLTLIKPGEYQLPAPKRDIDLLSRHYSPEQVRELGQSIHTEDYIDESEYRTSLKPRSKPALPLEPSEKPPLPENLFDAELSHLRESRIKKLYGEEGLERYKRGEEANPDLANDSSILRTKVLPSRIGVAAKDFPFYGTPYVIADTPILYIPEEELKARGLNPNRKIGSHLLQYLPDYLFEGQFTIRNNEYSYIDSDKPVPFSFQHQLHVLDRLEQETALVFAAKADFEKNYSAQELQRPWAFLKQKEREEEQSCIINRAD